MQVKLVSWFAFPSLLKKVNELPKDESGCILFEVDTGAKVGDFLDRIGIPEDNWIIVVNDEIQNADYVLQPNDRIGVHIFLSGG